MYSSESVVLPSPTFQIHVHDIFFDCIEADQDEINLALEYTVKEAKCFTDSVAPYTNLDADNIIARGNFFIRMKLHSNVSLPPIEARCRFQRHGEARGQVALLLRPSLSNQASFSICQHRGL
jgi:hypothetical protein